MIVSRGITDLVNFDTHLVKYLIHRYIAEVKECMLPLEGELYTQSDELKNDLYVCIKVIEEYEKLYRTNE